MNEKLQYASMLEMPVSTCSVSALPKKRRFRKKKRVNDELVKQELLKKVNAEQDLTSEMVQDSAETLIPQENQLELASLEQEVAQNPIQIEQNTSNVYQSSRKHKKSPFKITVIGIQLVIIGVLVATLLSTPKTPRKKTFMPLFS